MRVGELLSLETSVLNALCLTINTAGSELKYKILDTVSEDDFYFPINRTIFNVLTDMHQRGDFVVVGNLDEELRNRSAEVPAGYFLDDLFRGDLPAATKLTQWLAQLKERAASGLPPLPEGKTSESRSSSSSGSRAAKTPPPPPAAMTQVRPASEPRKAAPPARRAASPTVLASEGEEWGDYLSELATKQGKTFTTGFAGFDEQLGGLGPGLMLVLDTDADRLCGFLKQLADQVVEHSRLPCLYLSFERPKAALRIRTLARLAGVSSQDIEKGRLKRDSRDWQRVEDAGRQAAEWMKRLYVVEADPGTGAGLVRDMCQRLLTTSGEPTCLVVIDSLERLGMGSESLRSAIAELKKLSESLDVLVVAATASSALAADRSIDLTAALREANGSVVDLEVLRSGDTQSVTLRFDYARPQHRFSEQGRGAARKG
jgi:hypothetical protein